MKEQKLYSRIQAAHSPHGVLFRNNVGTGYQGKISGSGPDKCLRELRFIEYGLCKGSSDLIGWTEIIITPDMIGQKLAVFTAVEVKKKGGRVSKEQSKFIDIVNSAGGIGKIEFHD